MSIRNVRFVKPGESDSNFFRELWSRGNFNLPDIDKINYDKQGEIEMAVQEYSRYLKFLYNIKKMINSPGFAEIEQALMEEIDNIDHVTIWSALEKGDKEEIDALRIRRTGIFCFFRSFSVISERIEAVAKNLTALGVGNVLDYKDNNPGEDDFQDISGY